MAQMSLGVSGAFCPTNVPLFQASGCSLVHDRSLVLIGA